LLSAAREQRLLSAIRGWRLVSAIRGWRLLSVILRLRLESRRGIFTNCGKLLSCEFIKVFVGNFTCIITEILAQDNGMNNLVNRWILERLQHKTEHYFTFDPKQSTWLSTQ
jgi:hypothetical protein